MFLLSVIYKLFIEKLIKNIKEKKFNVHFLSIYTVL